MASSSAERLNRQPSENRGFDESSAEEMSDGQYEERPSSPRPARRQNRQRTMQRRQQKGGPLGGLGGNQPLDNLALDNVGETVGGVTSGVTNTLGNVAGGAVDKKDDSKSDTLRLRLDLNLDIEITLKARIHGDLELALLLVNPSLPFLGPIFRPLSHILPC